MLDPVPIYVDSPPPRGRPHRVLLIGLLVLAPALALGIVSPAGMWLGLLGAAFAFLLGVLVGMWLTHGVKLPRDGRGLHERHVPGPPPEIDR